MSRTRLMQSLTIALLLPLLLAACAAPVPSPTEMPDDTPTDLPGDTPTDLPDDTPTDSPSTPTTAQQTQGAIFTEGVQVIPGSHIQFRGRSTLPDGTRLEAELSADDAPVNWWPDETSIEVVGRRWQLRVPLGEDEAPEDLSPEVQYVLHVWESGNPEIEAPPFPFNLSAPPAPKPAMTVGIAEVEEIDILIMESFPVQVAVVAGGALPDACTQIDRAHQRFDAESNTFTVEITTLRDPEEVCAQVLTPFEERIALDVEGLPAGTYTVDVNGVTDTFTLDVDNVPPDESSQSEISWDEARALILAGDVAQLTQLHSREVTLELKDGRRVVTTEPQLDDVFNVVDECGDACADIVLATE